MTARVKNPWASLQRRGGTYTVPEDRPYLDAFNRGRRGRGRLQLELIPEAFIGDPKTARVVILQLNPGFIAADRFELRNPAFRRAALANLHGTRADYSFFLLDPRFERTPGGLWWRRHLRGVLERVENDRLVAKRLMAVEFHGYHSSSFQPFPITLPSQWYGFDLVHQAVARGSLVVVLRGWNLWSLAVPELSAAKGKVMRHPNPRSAYVTERGWSAQAVRRIAAAIVGD